MTYIMSLYFQFQFFVYFIIWGAWGHVDGDSSSLGKPNSNRRVPHSIVLRLVHLVGMLWCKERHLGLAKGNSY